MAPFLKQRCMLISNDIVNWPVSQWQEATTGSFFTDLGVPQAKRTKRDGLKLCSSCDIGNGLRAKKCKSCDKPFPEKVKNWQKIADHAENMKDSYIKEKLFDRMDQLSTKKGWTAVTFLFHEVEGNDNRKRVFSHSYATRGKGDKLLNAIKDKFTTAMKRFMEGEDCKDPRKTQENEAVAEPMPEPNIDHASARPSSSTDPEPVTDVSDSPITDSVVTDSSVPSSNSMPATTISVSSAMSKPSESCQTSFQILSSSDSSSMYQFVHGRRPSVPTKDVAVPGENQSTSKLPQPAVSSKTTSSSMSEPPCPSVSSFASTSQSIPTSSDSLTVSSSNIQCLVVNGRKIFVLKALPSKP